MTNTEIFFAIISAIETLAMIILAVIAMNRRTEVSIIPDAVSKAEFHALKEKTDALELSNVKAWEKMEKDRLEASEKIGTVAGDIKAVKSTTEAISATVQWMASQIRLNNTK